MSFATLETAIDCLSKIFSTDDIPDAFVSDDGTKFTSEELKTFMKHNGVHHLHSVPYHSATNGLAEQAVQSFKNNMNKETLGTIATNVARFLFTNYHTPHTMTGVTSAELLLGRIP